MGVTTDSRYFLRFKKIQQLNKIFVFFMLKTVQIFGTDRCLQLYNRERLSYKDNEEDETVKNTCLRVCFFSSHGCGVMGSQKMGVKKKEREGA